SVLQRLPIAGTPAGRRALAHGLDWTLGMQGRDGGWAAFDTDNESRFLDAVPFPDLQGVTDPPSAHTTGPVPVTAPAHAFGPALGAASAWGWGACGVVPSSCAAPSTLTGAGRGAGESTPSTARGSPSPGSLPRARTCAPRTCSARSRGSRHARTRMAGGARASPRTTTTRGEDAATAPRRRRRGR